MTTRLTPANTTPSTSTPDNWLTFADRLHRALRRSPELS